MSTMHAVRAHRRGGPEELVYEEAPRPEPTPGEVLVAVHAASITPGELTWDATWTDRRTPGGRERTPIVPAHEMSGVVAALGPGVTGTAVGDEVFGLIPFVRDGAAAEYVTVPADVLAAKPATVDHEAAAAVAMPALTAWQALVRHAGLQAGQHVLVHGAAGGVGSLAVQVAADLGARVTATAGARDRGFVTELGAHEVVDYRAERFEDRVAGVDVVLDLVGGETQERSWAVLRPGGVLVSVAAPPDAGEAAAHGARGVFFIVEPDRAELETLARLVETGRLAPVVDRVVPLAGTRAAYEELPVGHRRGKIVIGVARPAA
ncbi:NADP-dependent oxidoreductase [Dactylosporangium sp. NPDC049140]|uniref:NADP-dependent oxidoreductase n=1 Tax=Dactylosporangium sp. NPDC049140 TaxID=3155647 RepID=UPI0034074663